jgi:cell division initiation protein
LDEVIDEFKALSAENEVLKKEIKAVKALERNIKETEETIMNTLVSAQKSSERILREAARKAELLIDNADNTAKQKTEQTKKNLSDMERKLAAIKQSANNFAVSFSEMMSAQAVAFEKTYQGYFGDMDVYSSGGINLEALEKLNSSIAGDISKLVEAVETPKEKILKNEQTPAIDEELTEENLDQLEIEWSVQTDVEPEMAAEEESVSAEEEPGQMLDESEALDQTIEEPTEEKAGTEQEQKEEKAENKIVKDEPAVPLEPVEIEEKKDESDYIPLNEINKALSDIENYDGLEQPERNKFDDYSWLYGDDDKVDEGDSSVSLKDPKESENLKKLIDDVIE